MGAANAIVASLVSLVLQRFKQTHQRQAFTARLALVLRQKPFELGYMFSQLGLRSPLVAELSVLRLVACSCQQANIDDPGVVPDWAPITESGGHQLHADSQLGRRAR